MEEWDCFECFERECRLGLWATHQVSSKCWWECTTKRRSGRWEKASQLGCCSLRQHTLHNLLLTKQLSSKLLLPASSVALWFDRLAAPQPLAVHLYGQLSCNLPSCPLPVLVQHLLLSWFRFPHINPFVQKREPSAAAHLLFLPTPPPSLPAWEIISDLFLWLQIWSSSQSGSIFGGWWWCLRIALVCVKNARVQCSSSSCSSSLYLLSGPIGGLLYRSD